MVTTQEKQLASSQGQKSGMLPAPYSAGSYLNRSPGPYAGSAEVEAYSLGRHLGDSFLFDRMLSVLGFGWFNL